MARPAVTINYPFDWMHSSIIHIYIDVINDTNRNPIIHNDNRVRSIWENEWLVGFIPTLTNPYYSYRGGGFISFKSGF